MATTRNYRQGSVNPAANDLNWLFRPEAVVDATLQTLAAADIAQIFDALAGFLILGVAMEVLTAEGGTLTVDVGLTGVDVDAWLDAGNGNAAAGTLICSGQAYSVSTTNANVVADANTIYGLVGAKFMATADSVDALYNDEADTAVLRYSMCAIQMKGAMPFGPTPV